MHIFASDKRARFLIWSKSSFYEYPTRPALFRTTAVKPLPKKRHAGHAFFIWFKNRLCVFNHQLSKKRAKFGDKVLPLKPRCCQGQTVSDGN